MDIYQIIISIGLILMIAIGSFLTDGSQNGHNPRKKDLEDKLFEDEAEAWGLTEDEKKDCIESGLTPEEWVEENDSEYYQENK